MIIDTIGEPALLEQTAEEALCAGISQSIGEEFSLSKNEVSVICYGFSLEEMRAERIQPLRKGFMILS